MTGDEMTTEPAASIGIIGGSGLYGMAELEVREKRHIETPFGQPSDSFVLGDLAGVPVAFLPRHGRGHRILPNELNFRANIWAFKTLGVERIVSLSAVGSMKEEYEPTHLVVVDQFLDRTRHRVDTFFGDGLAAHVSLADPVCSEMVPLLVQAGRSAGAVMHEGGTYLCMEGPQFSTRAESLTYRGWGVDVIGMTNLQEAKLAREAEICYATLALITDYDCWHEDEDAVSTTSVVEVLQANATMAQRVVAEAVKALPRRSSACRCGMALEGAVMTSPEQIPEETLKRVRPIVARSLGLDE